MDVSIQEASTDCIAGIRELVLEWGYAADEHQLRPWLDALLDSLNHKVFIAVSDGLIAGWLVVEKRISLGTGFTAEITGMVVGSKFRRLGIGHLLVSAAEDWSQDMGLSQVVVRSNVSRVEPHDFYQSIGFGFEKTTHVYSKPLKSA